jgi:hypothetical protein
VWIEAVSEWTQQAMSGREECEARFFARLNRFDELLVGHSGTRCDPEFVPPSGLGR